MRALPHLQLFLGHDIAIVLLRISPQVIETTTARLDLRVFPMLSIEVQADIACPNKLATLLIDSWQACQ